MGGFIAPGAIIGGSATAPSIKLQSTPNSGLFETPEHGVGFALGLLEFLNYNNQFASFGNIPAVSNALTAIAGSPFTAGTAPRDAAMSPDGSHVFIANAGSNNLSVYARNTATGVLSPVAGSPFATDVNPIGAVVSPDGVHVLVCHGAGAATIAVFTRNAATGFLTAVAGSPFALLGQANGNIRFQNSIAG